MGMINYGVPRNLVLAAKQHFAIHAFVETGTFRGDTAEFAAAHFDRVFTVELVAERFQACRSRLQVHRNVTCLAGNSPDAIRQIALSLGGSPTLFWLDAHWNGDGASREFECPVLGELRAINDSNLNAFILVDDARYFLAPPPPPSDPDAWPTLGTLVPLLAHGDRHIIMVDDAIIAWPRLARPFLTQYALTRPAAWTASPAPSGGIFFIPRHELPPHTVISGA